jgi:hypothetical protein
MRVVVESEFDDIKSALTDRAYSMNVWRAFVAQRVEPVAAQGKVRSRDGEPVRLPG